jgi:hypothetical protein
MSVIKRILVILLTIVAGVFIVDGTLWTYVQLAGPFYPDSDQQQRNFDYFFITNIIVAVVSGVIGNNVHARYLRGRGN